MRIKMGLHVWATVLAAFAVPLTAVPASAQQKAPPATAAPAIEPAALERLKAMSDLLKSAKSFTLTAKVAREVRADNGQMLDFFARTSVAVSRPNRLRTHTEGDIVNASLWYDGKKAVIQVEGSPYYADIDAPPTLDETLALLIDRLQTPLPVAGFLVEDPYAKMIGGLTAASEVGVVNVDGIACRHIAFREAGADWQIWIEEGPRPLARRFSVDYTDLEGSPRVVMSLSDWDLNPKIAAGEFDFNPPAGSTKVVWLAGPGLPVPKVPTGGKP